MVHKIESGGEWGQKGPAGGPALRVVVRGTRSVRRRSGRRLTELYHAIDWGYLRLVLAAGATAYVAVRIALERMA